MSVSLPLSHSVPMMIILYAEQSRKCPLCARQIGEYLIHNIRSKYDYQKHYLAPLRTLSQLDTDQPLSRAQVTQRRRARREVEWGRNMRRERERERKAADELERAVEKRRWVYRHNLYAKVGLVHSAAADVLHLTAYSARCVELIHSPPTSPEPSAIRNQP